MQTLDLTVRIEIPGGLSIQLQPEDAIELAEAITRANGSTRRCNQ